MYNRGRTLALGGSPERLLIEGRVSAVVSGKPGGRGDDEGEHYKQEVQPVERLGVRKPESLDHLITT